MGANGGAHITRGTCLVDGGGALFLVDFIEKTRCVNQGAEIRRILDTKALRQASNLELLRKPPDV